jgi:hypothetical protein
MTKGSRKIRTTAKYGGKCQLPDPQRVNTAEGDGHQQHATFAIDTSPGTGGV